MSRTYRAPGDVVDYTNSSGSTITSGSLVAIGNLIGVVLGDILDTETGQAMVSGRHVLGKVNGADCLVNTNLQLDVSTGLLEDAAATPAAGDISGGCLCLVAAAAGTDEVEVLLLPGGGSVT